ncbi:MAG: hypothetical protein NVS9B14_23700 [Candidatus Acidiferrum sp.]
MLFYLGIAPYFIVRLFLRKTVHLSIPLCERHRRQTSVFGWIGIFALIAAIPAGYGTYSALGDLEGGIWGFFLSFFLLVLALILLWAHYPLRAVKIDKNCSVFEGADEAFLKLLPVSVDATQQLNLLKKDSRC